MSSIPNSKIKSIALITTDIRTEIVRKSIHLLSAFIPAFLAYNANFTVSLLLAGIAVYTAAEYIRFRGGEVLLISKITKIAARQRDEGHFILGPITLGLGILGCLLLYKEPAASIGIFAVALGDGLSSLVGKLFKGREIPLTGGKTFNGSFACFLVVFTAAFRITGDPAKSVLIGAAAAFLEALPLKDMDNIVVPLGTGFVSTLLLIV